MYPIAALVVASDGHVGVRRYERPQFIQPRFRVPGRAGAGLRRAALDHGGGLAPALLEALLCPGTAWVAAVLEHGHLAVRAPAAGDDLHLAVAVQVRGDGLKRIGVIGADHMLAPWPVRWVTIVFVPYN